MIFMSINQQIPQMHKGKQGIYSEVVGFNLSKCFLPLPVWGGKSVRYFQM